MNEFEASYVYRFFSCPLYKYLIKIVYSQKITSHFDKINIFLFDIQRVLLQILEYLLYSLNIA